ncbi:MAG: tRNA uridine-5-carboxymethylaminomethyl(34) synthesis GTPase MnmE [Kiritimatiellia bacterium]|nr:tRNA uridine-5-carboxymethylaminomethyl(34) synthesis GTPase MnmE [Kiritimatiellia bacterium]MDP6811063.1 tRNA uridine-5-carboxymethylaminomethyl(34) synthesis GTPase MnmE [Kiritimatiellia bacterium]
MSSIFHDTIAAVSTAPGSAGIAIVRLSGPQSLSITDSLIECCGDPPSLRPGGTFLHGRIVSDGAEVDEAIVLIFRAPHSYTRDDVVEIQGHGGRAAAERLLQAVLDAGARMAEPGEFTRRAFLNGRIDLLQAEAVADLIRARSDRAAAAAVEQLEGRLSAQLDALYDHLMAAAADLEASLDFDEGELPPSVLENTVRRLRESEQEIGALLDTWEEGHLLRDGARVVIAGQPNVGKSTLMNRLLGRERSIVTHLPGTTRDTIEETLVLGGIQMRLIDTAGLRDSSCLVEQQGVTRATDSIEQADLVLYLLDASRSVTEADRSQLEALKPEGTVVVQNKCDLLSGKVEPPDNRFETVTCSAAEDTGIDRVRDALKARLGQQDTPPHAVISERHRALLAGAHKLIEDARKLAQQDDALLVPAADMLRAALDMLGTITGRTYTTELLDTIFSRFCIGK